MSTSKTKFAILGVLCSEGPCAGYDIKKHIESSIGYFWNESYGNLYPFLRRLEDEGLATCSVEEQQGKPNRNVYTVTPAGRRSLMEWLQAEPDPQPLRHELLLKVFFGHHVGPGVIEGHVERYRVQLSVLLGQLEEVEGEAQAASGADPDFAYGYSALRMGILLTRARLEWCRETLQRLRDVDSEADQS